MDITAIQRMKQFAKQDEDGDEFIIVYSDRGEEERMYLDDLISDPSQLEELLSNDFINSRSISLLFKFMDKYDPETNGPAMNKFITIIDKVDIANRVSPLTGKPLIHYVIELPDHPFRRKLFGYLIDTCKVSPSSVRYKRVDVPREYRGKKLDYSFETPKSDERGYSLLEWTILSGDLALVSRLLNAGVNTSNLHITQEQDGQCYLIAEAISTLPINIKPEIYKALVHVDKRTRVKIDAHNLMFSQHLKTLNAVFYSDLSNLKSLYIECHNIACKIFEGFDGSVFQTTDNPNMKRARKTELEKLVKHYNEIADNITLNDVYPDEWRNVGYSGLYPIIRIVPMVQHPLRGNYQISPNGVVKMVSLDVVLQDPLNLDITCNAILQYTDNGQFTVTREDLKETTIVE